MLSSNLVVLRGPDFPLGAGTPGNCADIHVGYLLYLKVINNGPYAKKGWRGKDRDKSSCVRLGREGKDGEEKK